jgi:hypothetical protein
MGCREREGNTETRNGAGLPRAEQLVSGGSRPGGQAGRGWYLFETRSDVGSTGAKNRLRKRAGPRECCLCEDSTVLLLLGDVGVVEGKRRDRCEHGRSTTSCGMAVTRGGVSGGADCGRSGEGRAGSARMGRCSCRSRERACTRSEALRYARAIGISTRITIGGRWSPTVITLSFDRSATASCIVAGPLAFLHQSSRTHSKSVPYRDVGLLDTPRSYIRRPNLLCSRARAGRQGIIGHRIGSCSWIPAAIMLGDPDQVDTPSQQLMGSKHERDPYTIRANV